MSSAAPISECRRSPSDGSSQLRPDCLDSRSTDQADRLNAACLPESPPQITGSAVAACPTPPSHRLHQRYLAPIAPTHT
jgi:hypothetical protein